MGIPDLGVEYGDLDLCIHLDHYEHDPIHNGVHTGGHPELPRVPTLGHLL